MAFSAITTHCSQFVRLRISFPQTQTQTSVSFGFSPPNLRRLKPLSIRSVSLPATPASGSLAPAISLTDNALKHLNKMRSERNEDLCLRIGVKQGGCSGMSYTMDFENMANTRPDDSIIEYEGFLIDYSDALIGGGFSFKNPNATQTCGCGKSFAAEM
ncbi:iron-sulfur assembly protein IscA, chloroplastic isoform X3 [Abrus precatorius]|uniref:Iron-sulfur assembly protein IscA, chloroplastic isoform X3 n=1 Tax=Abrus precatorius TaxID=3816 RepID=A0A8B8MD94_ABRPR|nr:iron-sulfur assembly protein IscA, chloroplastic isoform X3 [Abrus precatorius]